MALAIPLGIPWASLLNVILLEGRSGLFAVSQTLAPIVQLAATAAALWWGLGVTGLCIGYMAGVLVTTACVVPILLAHWRWTLDFNILGDMRRMAGLAIASNAMEAVMAWAERSQLARALDTYSVGIYAHSQNYRAMLMSGCISVTRAVHPATMAEARADPMNFRVTTRTWNILFLILASPASLRPSSAPRLSGFLTHGKFTAAGPLVPLWCMIAVLQHVARPQLYAMLARGHGRGLAAIKLIATAIGTASLLVSVPLLGLFGPVLSVAIKELSTVDCSMRAPTGDGSWASTTGARLRLFLGLQLPLTLVICWAKISSRGLRCARSLCRLAASSSADRLFRPTGLRQSCRVRSLRLRDKPPCQQWHLELGRQRTCAVLRRNPFSSCAKRLPPSATP